MQIFISHSSKDIDVATMIRDFLEEKGAKCFFAPRDIRSGREYAEEIINGIEQSNIMLLVMSKEANESPHVLREVERAVSKSIPILVYKLEEVDLSKSMEYFLMTHQWMDVKNQKDFSLIWDYVCDLEKPSNKRFLWVAAITVLLAIVGLGVWQLVRMSNDAGNSYLTYEVGDTVTFGSYNDEAIDWRVLRVSEDGTEAVLVSKDIVTIKAYDAAESGTYNVDGDEDYWTKDSLADTDLELQLKVRGNNDWSVSNIRTWLNSVDEVVAYADQAPATAAMSEKRNGYNNEPGFLHGFTEEELNAILQTELTTKGNALADGAVVTTDKVYLLSMEELAWFEEAGISMLAVPTEAAIASDDSNWYEISLDEYGTESYFWWLREPVEGTSSVCYMVGNGYSQEITIQANVGLEGYGIRPAITVNLEADCFAKEQ